MKEPAASAMQRSAPEWYVETWFNHDGDLHLADLRGRVVALKAFLHEYKVRFPVGVDRPTANRSPETMTRFELQGTPSLLLFDRNGQLRAHHFGAVSDMKVGAEISALLTE